MRILMIGGTAFVGRHMAAAALEAGHDVTLFHRGKTGTDLFPQATHLSGDRDEDLSALAAGSWDATIDVCAYFPRQVRSLATALGGRGGTYVFISSVSAYSPSVPPNYDESAPLAAVDGSRRDGGHQRELRRPEGGVRAGRAPSCSDRTRRSSGRRTSSGRTTAATGSPGGSTGWPGAAPCWRRAIPDDPIQLIDARDQAAFTVSLLERSITGTFHTVSPAPPFGFGQMLEAIAAEVAPPGTQLTWASSEFLLEHGVDGEMLPLWAEGEDDGANMSRANPAAAFAAGLTPRPLRETVADIRAEDRAPGTGAPWRRHLGRARGGAARPAGQPRP